VFEGTDAYLDLRVLHMLVHMMSSGPPDLISATFHGLSSRLTVVPVLVGSRRA